RRRTPCAAAHGKRGDRSLRSVLRRTVPSPQSLTACKKDPRARGMVAQSRTEHAAHMTTLTPIAHQPGTGEHLWFFGGLTTIKAAGDGAMVTEQTAPRGSGSPPHVHHKQDEWFYVLQGELTIWVDGETHLAPPRS